jgi:predicted secreted protein
MNGITRSIARTMTATIALALLIGMVPMAASAQVTDDNVVQQLQSAKTPADHQALADYFNAKAEAAAANAAKHESMAGVSQRGAHDVWREHCSSLVKTYRRQASDYRALAKQQEQLAKAGAH